MRHEKVDEEFISSLCVHPPRSGGEQGVMRYKITKKYRIAVWRFGIFLMFYNIPDSSLRGVKYERLSSLHDKFCCGSAGAYYVDAGGYAHSLRACRGK